MRKSEGHLASRVPIERLDRAGTWLLASKTHHDKIKGAGKYDCPLIHGVSGLSHRHNPKLAKHLMLEGSLAAVEKC